MIELLVAVLVVGIGVLGVTGLQMVSLQNNRSALLRGEAVQLAYDMMDRVRANPDGDYGGLAIGDVPPAVGNDCIAADCSVADMTAFDQASWKCALGNFSGEAVCAALRGAGALPPADTQPGLPSGDGAVDVDAGSRRVTITVRWQEPNAPNPTNIVIESQG